VWIGKGVAQPFPAFPFMTLTSPNVCAVHQRVRYNWFQNVEGLVDSAHVSILHQDWLAKLPKNPNLAKASANTAPIYEFEEVPGGFRYAAIRKLNEQQSYVRVTEFHLPWCCFIPSDQEHLLMSVPIDDENTMSWIIRYDSKSPVEPSMYTAPDGGPEWPPYLPAGRDQRWGQDRHAMKNGSFTGFPQHLLHEDYAVAESQGVIADRSHEFLNAGDVAVVRTRSMLLRAVQQFTVDEANKNIKPIGLSTTKASSFVMPNNENWRRLAQT
jgi:phthalate 4,5-dioxygenase oxygenase subunit